MSDESREGAVEKNQCDSESTENNQEESGAQENNQAVKSDEALRTDTESDNDSSEDSNGSSEDSNSSSEDSNSSSEDSKDQVSSEKSTDAGGKDAVVEKELAMEREEQRLDALDASPENKRRTAIILTIIVVLLILVVVVVVVCPPLSWQPEKKNNNSFHPVAEIVNVVEGSGAPAEFSYQTVESEKIFKLNYEQTSHYAGDKIVRTTLETDIVIVRPETRQFEDQVMIKLAHVDTHVFDGDKELKLTSAGEMLEGIPFYTRISTHNGMSSVVPEDNINPQVARVLFITGDVLRFVWTPVPEKSVTDGGSWTFRDNPGEKVPLIRGGHTTLGQDGALIRLVTDYHLSAAENREVGTGSVTVLYDNGVPVKAEGSLKRTEKVSDGPDSQDVTFKLVPRAKENS